MKIKKLLIVAKLFLFALETMLCDWAGTLYTKGVSY